MQTNTDKDFGMWITRLIQKQDLGRQESKAAFHTILKNETTEMQQGAFLAALTAKGETEEEVAGSWEAIYEVDTVKVKLVIRNRSWKTAEPGWIHSRHSTSAPPHPSLPLPAGFLWPGMALVP